MSGAQDVFYMKSLHSTVHLMLHPCKDCIRELKL
ncbi:MAG: hypothetical protein EZS28_034274, partial [Streblomastix strix]